MMMLDPVKKDTFSERNSKKVRLLNKKKTPLFFRLDKNGLHRVKFEQGSPKEFKMSTGRPVDFK